MIVRYSRMLCQSPNPSRAPISCIEAFYIHPLSTTPSLAQPKALSLPICLSPIGNNQNPPDHARSQTFRSRPREAYYSRHGRCTLHTHNTMRDANLRPIRQLCNGILVLAVHT
ncbi:hypothetical protein BDV97DRAFT_84706 [Delphinella strobiligena]|nr:hypothetical protein BDV97DRAFT_84706 [Delphinella strobiligena]